MTGVEAARFFFQTLVSHMWHTIAMTTARTNQIMGSWLETIQTWLPLVGGRDVRPKADNIIYLQLQLENYLWYIIYLQLQLENYMWYKGSVKHDQKSSIIHNIIICVLSKHLKLLVHRETRGQFSSFSMKEDLRCSAVILDGAQK